MNQLFSGTVFLLFALFANFHQLHFCPVADHAHENIESSFNDHGDNENHQAHHSHIHRHDENSPYHEHGHEHNHGQVETKLFTVSPTFKFFVLSSPDKVFFSYFTHFSDVTLAEDVRPPIVSHSI